MTKVTRDPKSELNDLDLYLTRHPKYAHTIVDTKPELTRTESYSTQNFLQRCLFFRLIRNRREPKFTLPKLNKPEMLHNLKHDLI